MKVFNITLDEYIEFIKNLYCNELGYINSKLENLSHITNTNLTLYKNTKQKLIAVKQDSKILCGALIIIPNTDNSSLYLSFFEAIENVQEEVDFLVNYIKKYALEHNCEKIVIGVDGHINYSIGFSYENTKPSFAECYTKLYYQDYFKKTLTPVNATSFYNTPDKILPILQADMQKLNSKRTSKVVIEQAQFDTNFDKTLKRYTDLNNNLFGNHKYYYKRSYQEDYEVFTDLLPLLDNKNLIFATIDGKDVGYLFWLPDFNEFIEKNDVDFDVYNKFRNEGVIPKTTKVLELSADRNFLREGITLQLFYHAINNTNPDKIISSWIFDDNKNSALTTKRYMQMEYKKYTVYEMIL